MEKHNTFLEWKTELTKRYEGVKLTINKEKNSIVILLCKDKANMIVAKWYKDKSFGVVYDRRESIRGEKLDG